MAKQGRDKLTPEEIQKQLKANGVAPDPEADETSSGPASLVVVDPDGNPLLIDQHV